VTVVELFGGPGGWGIALDALGLHAIALEWDHDACLTRVSNGLTAIRADVAAYPPARFAGATGLVASPPCPQFSNSGAGHGRTVMAELRAAIVDVWNGADDLDRHLEVIAAAIYDKIVSRASWPLSSALRLACDAEDAGREALLMVEPARWLRALPSIEWVAMEQVPAALPLYRLYADLLAAAGWRSAWAVKLCAEQYGVPQTRMRAIIGASRERVVHPPVATHQKYVSGVAAGDAAECAPSLFGPGVLPWVSMAEALGFGMSERPALTLAPGHGGGGGPDIVQEHGAERRGDEPAPTILASHDNGNKAWQLNTRRDQRPDGSTQRRPTDEPAPTVTAQAGKGQWVWERPATTVMGDPSLWPPGHKINGGDVAAGRAGGLRSRGDTVRLTVEQAAVLQSFPLEYRFAGTKTSQFAQIGNAVPPVLAYHVLAAVTGAGTA